MESGQIASAPWNGTFSSSLHPHGRKNPKRNQAHPKTTGTTATWRAYETPNLTNTYSKTTVGAPLTSFTFGRGAPTEVSDYLFVLSAGNNGVRIDWWDNSDPASTHWGSPQNPDVMTGVRSLSPIAANAAGHVFAFEEGVVREFKVAGDGVTWTVVGDVTRS